MNRRRDHRLYRRCARSRRLPRAFADGLCPAPAPDARLQGFGIVYLHGKGAWPGAFNGGILSSLRR